MNKKVIFGILFLIAILFSLSIPNTVALTPSGFWGTSTGDKLYYRTIDNSTGSMTTIDSRVVITSIYNGTDPFLSLPYNFMNATTYWYTGKWELLFSDTIFTGYNDTTFAWFGGVVNGVPSPAPVPVIPAVLNLSILATSYASLYNFLIFVSVVGNKLTYTNFTDTLIVDFDASGICTNLTHLRSSSLIFSQEYLGETDPYKKEEEIPGYNLYFIIAICGAVTFLIINKIKSKI